MRFTFSLVSALILIALSSQIVAAATPTKYALLIGINEYKGSGFPNLRGAKNDIELVRDVLIQRFEFEVEHITTLVDGQATHKSIVAAFDTLANRINLNDIAYIHYSGHGSLTPDLNGDEKKEGRNLDSTWVPFGARSTEDNKSETAMTAGRAEPAAVQMSDDTAAPHKDLNDYDILDDEINVLLAKLSTKTDQLIFVSDSCHSGTVYRGGVETMATRGIPMDLRANPQGDMPVIERSIGGLRISACRDDQKASEYQPFTGAIHGMFSWFWAQSLSEAGPGDTFYEVFQRTSAKISNQGAYQNPQIEGNADLLVYGGHFEEKARLIPLTWVSRDGAKARIQAGALLGVTKGSTYQKPSAAGGGAGTLVITDVGSTYSIGQCTGSFQVGDLVRMASYQPAIDPIRITLLADLDEDQQLLDRLHQAITNMPAFEVVSERSEYDLLLYVLRPKRNKDGKDIYGSPDDSLPLSFSDADPQCWFLLPDQRLYEGQENLKIVLNGEGKTLVRRNLERIAKIRNLTQLTAGPDQESFMELTATLWEPATEDDPAREMIDGKPFKKIDTVLAQGLDNQRFKVGTVLTFSIKNNSDVPYYAYLVNISQNGSILPFFPNVIGGQNIEYGKIVPGATRNVDEVSLLMDVPQKEYIRLIASKDPIDIRLLAQTAYERGTRGNLNPLESLLSACVGLTRGSAGKGFTVKEWSTQQEMLIIEP